MTERWVYVSLPWATFALVTEDGTITGAAPIARWAIGKPEQDVAAHYRKRGAVFRQLAPVSGTGEEDSDGAV
jgi:hypothetical protein